jgi:hypothetical protein
MNLYIEIENGQPKNHPALEDNLLQAFETIPENWEPFFRVERPVLGIYEVLESNEPVYAKEDGVWTDVWNVRTMTEEEKTVVQQSIIDIFNSRSQIENWSAWVFDETIGKMVPPIPRPEKDQTKIDSGIMTFWCGADNNWKDTPAKPVDGNEYVDFDFFAWQWIKVSQTD